MDELSKLEAQSVYILREAYNRIEPLAMLWSLGKDSNVMVWLARQTHRYINPSLLVGTLVVLAALAVGIITLATVGSQVRVLA